VIARDERTSPGNESRPNALWIHSNTLSCWRHLHEIRWIIRCRAV